MNEIDSLKRYNKVLDIIDKRLVPDEDAKKQRGEVFTPLRVVREMLFGIHRKTNETWGITKDGEIIEEDEQDRVGGIPLEIFRDPNTKWLDPANGIGNFPVVAFYMLDYQLNKHGKNKEFRGDHNIKKRREHIVQNMLYMIELNKGNVNASIKIFKLITPTITPNVCCSDTLKITDEKLIESFGINRFDVIMGNPPFNSPKKGKSTGNSIWMNIVMKSYSLLNQTGVLCFIHPPGWKKPTDEDFNPEKYVNGDYTKEIFQGKIWKVLKEHGTFSFIYTNDQDKKKKHEAYLPYFPSVDYYVYQKGLRQTRCDTKNIFLGQVFTSTDVKLNYDLTYLPNLITKETQTIVGKITSKKGEKIAFQRGIDDRNVIWKGDEIKWVYNANKSGFQYKDFGMYAFKKKQMKDTVTFNKIIINFGGGFDAYHVEYISKNDPPLGVLDKTLYGKVENDAQGEHIKSFLNSDIVRFICLITQYADGSIEQNEPLVFSSITIPPVGTTDYYHFFDIERYKNFIEKVLQLHKDGTYKKETLKDRKNANKTAKNRKKTNSTRKGTNM